MPTVRRALLTALLALLAIAPAAAAAPPRGFYGVMWDRAASSAPPTAQDEQWALMARSGVETVRTAVPWAAAQPAAGDAPDFTETDRLVELSARHGIDLLPVVLGTPGWAARNPADPSSPPARPADYAAYLRALVARYGPDGSLWAERPDLPRRPVREWQIWNEPHIGLYWSTRGRSRNAWAPEYARLLRAAKAAIEDVDPGATVVLAGLADFAWRHLTRLYRHGIRNDFDVASFNLFTARPRLVLKGVGLMRRSLRRGGEPRKPIWLTETTWPAAKNRVAVPRAAWQRAWYTTDAGMARRVTQMYALAERERRRLRLGRLYWYTWGSSYRGDDLFDYSGLLSYRDGAFTRRPALAAYAASARR
jgi:hypothetical protein